MLERAYLDPITQAWKSLIYSGFPFFILFEIDNIRKKDNFIFVSYKDQNSLDLKIGNEIIEYYSFQLEPWMDPEEES